VEEFGVITEYVERIARELDFDRSLARRVSREVEDHLREASAVDERDGPEAERRAVAAFGDARAIASQFAVVSLAARARRTAMVALLAVLGAFFAMKARLAAYALASSSGIDMGALGAIVGSIDRYAFWCAVAAALAAWFYIDSRRTPAALTPGYRRQLRRFFAGCACAAVALAISIACDGVLTGLRLLRPTGGFELAIPLLTMAVEVASIALFIGYLFLASQRLKAPRAS
jgi:hypothetical protein